MRPNRTQYYQGLKEIAGRIRTEHGVQGYSLNRTELKSLCKKCGVDRIDLWPPSAGAKGLKKLRGAYFCDDCGCSILLSRKLPDEPAIFTLAHELKHHLVDQDTLNPDSPALFCDDSHFDEEVEIGAEIFAAELLFPEQDFLDIARSMGVSAGKLQPEDIVRLKHETGTILSYASLSKRSEFFGLALSGTLSRYSGWIKLQEELYGIPLYKQLRQRKRS